MHMSSIASAVRTTSSSACLRFRLHARFPWRELALGTSAIFALALLVSVVLAFTSVQQVELPADPFAAIGPSFSDQYAFELQATILLADEPLPAGF